MTERPCVPGDFAVVLVCACSERHAPTYCVRGVSRQDAEVIASELARTNGHDFMIVRSNGLELTDPHDFYRPTTTTATNTLK